MLSDLQVSFYPTGTIRVKENTGLSPEQGPHHGQHVTLYTLLPGATSPACLLSMSLSQQQRGSLLVLRLFLFWWQSVTAT